MPTATELCEQMQRMLEELPEPPVIDPETIELRPSVFCPTGTVYLVDLNRPGIDWALNGHEPRAESKQLVLLNPRVRGMLHTAGFTDRDIKRAVLAWQQQQQQDQPAAKAGKRAACVSLGLGLVRDPKPIIDPRAS